MYSYLLPRNYPNTQYQRGQQAQQPAEPAPIGHRGLVTQPTQPTSNRNPHAWRLTGFTQCTHSCAGGSTSSANHFHLTWFGIVENNWINLTSCGRIFKIYCVPFINYSYQVSVLKRFYFDPTGIQKTVHQCVSLADNSVVEQSLCSADPKPPQRQRVCNLQSCPPR